MKPRPPLVLFFFFFFFGRDQSGRYFFRVCNANGARLHEKADPKSRLRQERFPEGRVLEASHKWTPAGSPVTFVTVVNKCGFVIQKRGDKVCWCAAVCRCLLHRPCLHRVCACAGHFVCEGFRTQALMDVITTTLGSTRGCWVCDEAMKRRTNAEMSPTMSMREYLSRFLQGTLDALVWSES